MGVKRPITPQMAVAVVLSEFAARWDGRLEKLAARVACQCQPPRTSRDESEHDPDCPVGLLRQAGRLMCEEADEYRETKNW